MSEPIPWQNYSNLERYEKFSLDKGESATIKFLDDGKFVDKKVLKESGAKFARDSFVFVIEDNGKKKEFWLGTKAFSVMSQLKLIREKHNNTLENLAVKVTRISDSPKQTNYDVREI